MTNVVIEIIAGIITCLTGLGMIKLVEIIDNKVKEKKDEHN